MKTKSKIQLAFVLATTLFTSMSFAGPGGHSPNDFPRRVATKEEAMECCVPKAKVALACKDCKTLDVKNGEDKKGILSWFTAPSTHGCSGCGGKIEVTAASSKGIQPTRYVHTCSKCGDKSAYVCTDHKKA